MAKNCGQLYSSYYLCYMKMTLKEIAKLVGGEVEGDENVEISGPSKIEEGEKGTLTFLGNQKYEKYLYTTNASAVLVDRNFQPRKEISTNLIRVENVYEAIGELLRRFDNATSLPEGIDGQSKISELAQISENARIGAFVFIGDNATIGDYVSIHPHVYIGPGVHIGDHTILYPGARVMHDCEIGKNCIIHPNAVIGSDGFGFAQNEKGEFTKVSQTGNVIIEDEVEVGAASTIDRATLGSTIIHKGAKIDNQVQIAHNVKVGKNTAIAAQAGIAGSSRIGENCLIGGQAGVVGHVSVEDGTQVQAQSGIASSTKQAGRKLYGSPALDYNNYLRSYVAFSKLPQHLQKLKELEDRIAELESKTGK